VNRDGFGTGRNWFALCSLVACWLPCITFRLCFTQKACTIEGRFSLFLPRGGACTGERQSKADFWPFRLLCHMPRKPLANVWRMPRNGSERAGLTCFRFPCVVAYMTRANAERRPLVRKVEDRTFAMVRTCGCVIRHSSIGLGFETSEMNSFAVHHESNTPALVTFMPRDTTPF
jgi:hypothetical protein